MKKLLALILLLPSLGSAANVAQTYISISSFTPSADGTYSWGFRNTDADVNVQVHAIHFTNCTDNDVTGGFVHFELLPTTSHTPGGTTQTSTHTMRLSNMTWPSGVVASTGPVAVVLENASALSLPIYPILTVDTDESAAIAGRTQTISGHVLSDTQELFLPKGGTRGIVARKRKADTTDFTVGCVQARVEFTTSN